MTWLDSGVQRSRSRQSEVSQNVVRTWRDSTRVVAPLCRRWSSRRPPAVDRCGYDRPTVWRMARGPCRRPPSSRTCRSWSPGRSRRRKPSRTRRRRRHRSVGSAPETRWTGSSDPPSLSTSAPTLLCWHLPPSTWSRRLSVSVWRPQSAMSSSSAVLLADDVRLSTGVCRTPFYTG